MKSEGVDTKVCAMDEEANFDAGVRCIIAAASSAHNGNNNTVPSGSSAANAASNGDNAVLSEMFSELGRTLGRRETTIGQHLNSIRKALVPGIPLQFMTWVLSQNDKFYTDGTGLWNQVFKHECGLSDEQRQQLLALRVPMKQRKAMPDTEGTFAGLDTLVRRHVGEAHANFESIRRVLTADQCAKLLKWISAYGHVCVRINT